MQWGKIITLTLAMLFSAWAWAEPVNINTADAKAIAKQINGVGEKKALAIVAYREQNGPFTSVYDLVKIKGIGKKTIEKNLDNLTVGESESKTDPVVSAEGQAN